MSWTMERIFRRASIGQQLGLFRTPICINQMSERGEIATLIPTAVISLVLWGGETVAIKKVNRPS